VKPQPEPSRETVADDDAMEAEPDADAARSAIAVDRRSRITRYAPRGGPCGYGGAAAGGCC